MLHLATVEPFTLGLLKDLMSKTYIDPFVLVGGTALSLQMGHRRSVDLDLFTTDSIDTDDLLSRLEAEFKIMPKVQTKGSLIAEIEGVKVDFIKFKYEDTINQHFKLDLLGCLFAFFWARCGASNPKKYSIQPKISAFKTIDLLCPHT